MENEAPNAPTTFVDPPTRWAQATHGDWGAFQELAASYWYCAYAWWRRKGLDPDQATTATVATFTRRIDDAVPPGSKDTGGTRMREWLPRRLAEMSERGVEIDSKPVLQVDTSWAESRFAQEPEGGPDAILHRRWALTMLEFTLEAVGAEYATTNQQSLFSELAPFVGFDSGDEARYSALAERLRMTSGAARRAVFDFRTRHREVLRGLVADTVSDRGDIDREMTALLCACDETAAPVGAVWPLPEALGQLKPDEMFVRAMQSVRMTGGGSGLWTPPSEAEVARLFPQYEIIGMVGRGGMGAVYKARQVSLDRFVAIKLMPLEVSVDREFADRFVREAQTMARLNHPNIIAVFDFGKTAEGHLYFAMEFVEGVNLHEMIHGPGIAAAQALQIISGVCDALEYAHAKDVVHRDIKPANVMVNTEGQVKVADFGLARRLDPGAAAHGHTTIGTVLGTPDYMAPEQMRGNSVDHRADIYSLGVMLYEMLCKEVPRGMAEPPSQRVTVDARVDEVVKKAMQHLPERRYQRTSEMRTAVQKIRETPLPQSSASAISDTAAQEIDRYSFMPKAVPPPPSSSKKAALGNADETTAAHPEAGPAHEHAAPAEPSRSKPRGLLWPLLIIVILLVLGAAAFVLLGPGKDMDWTKLPWPPR